MGIDLFTYRRPGSVHSTDSGHSWNSVEVEKLRHKKINGIPVKLSFERIVNGEVCFPCRTIDFMNYLQYVEHDSENLRFYLWYQDYIKRFEALSPAAKALSPPCGADGSPALRSGEGWASPPPSALLSPRPIPSPVPGGPQVPANVVIASDENLNLLIRPSQDTYDPSRSSSPTPHNPTTMIESSPAFNEPVALKPFTIQPFREEINRIIQLYLSSSSPYELNLSSRDRTYTLDALKTTTHPSAFAPAFNTVETALRLQSHPNFVRYTVSNSNDGRNAMMRYGGLILMGLAFIGAVLLSLGTNNRGWRVAPPAIVFGVGWAMYLNGRRKVCFMLWTHRIRDRMPWEAEDEQAKVAATSGSEESRDSYFSASSDDDDIEKAKLTIARPGSSASGGAASYAPFLMPDAGMIDFQAADRVEKYQKRNVIMHLIGQTTPIAGVDPEIHRLQTLIVWQNVLMGFLSMGIVALFLVFLPRGNYF